jgi:hypothetical protein
LTVDGTSSGSESHSDHGALGLLDGGLVNAEGSAVTDSSISLLADDAPSVE